MEWLLSILLLLTVELRPAPVDRVLKRANARAHGLEILRGKTVLMFGDSMVNCGINVWLEPWLKRQGVSRYVTRSWASSTTVTWSTTHKLETYLWQFDPDIVIVVLGSNELFHPYPKMKIRPIRNILGRLGGQRLVLWVGPPAWKPDKGVIDVMRSLMPPGRFFDSAKVTMGRQKDGYHPSLKGSKVWAGAIRAWLTEQLVALSPPRRPRSRPATALARAPLPRRAPAPRAGPAPRPGAPAAAPRDRAAAAPPDRAASPPRAGAAPTTRPAPAAAHAPHKGPPE